MHFWERCFQQTYRAFTHRYQAGREDVLWWLEQADERGLLPWIELGIGALGTIRGLSSIGPETWNKPYTPRFFGATRPKSSRFAPIFIGTGRITKLIHSVLHARISNS
jgi:hypothetical protein